MKKPQLFSALILGLMLISIKLIADVKSDNGTIGFDADSDSTREMTLNSTGLGIGTSAQANLHVNGNSIISNKLGLGGEPTENTFHLRGTISLNPTISNGGTVDVTNSLIMVNTLTADGVISLPDVGDAAGRVYKIKKLSTSGNLYLSAGSNLIDTEVTLNILEDTTSSTLPSLSLISDGTQWWILHYDGPTVSTTGAANILIQYKLNETSGITASDDSGNSRDATLQNNHNFSGNTVAGAEMTALNFVDSEDILNYNEGSDLVTTQYTWAIWVNSVIDPDSTPTYPTANPTDDILGFNWSSGNSTWRKVAFHQKSDGDFVQAQLTTGLDANTWYHIAATWDGANLKAYLNGSLEATTAVTTLMSHSGNLNFHNPGSEPTSTTALDNFQLYDAALNSSEIQSLYNAGSP